MTFLKTKIICRLVAEIAYSSTFQRFRKTQTRLAGIFPRLLGTHCDSMDYYNGWDYLIGLLCHRLEYSQNISK